MSGFLENTGILGGYRMVKCGLCDAVTEVGHVLMVDFEGLGVNEILSVCDDCAEKIDPDEVDYEYVMSLDFSQEDRLLN